GGRTAMSRNRGWSSGAPPVTSSVAIAERSSSARHASTTASGITSRRSGPASTWQWRQVWLQRLPTLIWSVATRAARSGSWPARATAASKLVASGSSASVARWNRADASGCARRSSVGETFATAGPPRSHRDVVDVLAHLHAVHERAAALDRRRDVDRLGHLLEVGPLLEAGVRIGVDAVGALDRVRDAERHERLLALAQRALGPDR